MNFYEVSEPYYALIMANDEEEVYNLYVKNVSDDDGNLRREIKDVPKYYAVARYSRSKGEDGQLVDFNEMLEVLEGVEAHLLLVDGALI